MQKLWKVKKDSEGVSPVIATILMVAITVVLAAILMVMVMGMTDSNAPSATITATHNSTNETATVVDLSVSFISQSTAISDVSFTVTGQTGDVDDDWIGGGTSIVSGSTATVTLTTTSALPAGTYTLNMIYGGSTIATTTFTVPTAA